MQRSETLDRSAAIYKKNESPISSVATQSPQSCCKRIADSLDMLIVTPLTCWFNPFIGRLPNQHEPAPEAFSLSMRLTPCIYI